MHIRGKSTTKKQTSKCKKTKLAGDLLQTFCLSASFNLLRLCTSPFWQTSQSHNSLLSQTKGIPFLFHLICHIFIHANSPKDLPELISPEQYGWKRHTWVVLNQLAVYFCCQSGTGSRWTQKTDTQVPELNNASYTPCFLQPVFVMLVVTRVYPCCNSLMLQMTTSNSFCTSSDIFL